MKNKWVNGAMAMLLALSVLLAACSEAVPTPTPAPAATPLQTSPPKPASQAPTSQPPTSQPPPKPATQATAKPTAPPAPKPTSRALSKPAPAPKNEKVVVLAESFGLEGFLPSNDSMTAYKLLPVYEALWDVDPESRELRPMLAESLPEWSDDSKTLFINLRQGVQFHDGYGEMTAEDVKFTIEMAGRQGSVNPGAAVLAKAKVEILGPYKLAVHLPAPDWKWPLQNATMARFILPIVSKKHIEKLGEKEASRQLIGTGPFRFVKHEVGQTLEFEAVPNHWRITPDYKTLVIKLITEPATSISMLRTGEADIAAIPLSFVPEARAAGLDIRLQRNVGVIGVALGGLYLPSKDTFDPNVAWVQAKDPAKALKVRKALNLAVNRQEIIDKVLNGIGGTWPIMASPNNDASYDPAWKPYPYDPEQAKRLLAEAGYPNGFETTMVQFAATGHATREIAEAVATYWEKIGIKVKRLPMDQPTHRTRQIGRKNAGSAYPAYRNFSDEEAVNFDTAWGSKSTGMNFLFESAQLDAATAKAGSELNRDKRLALVREIHRDMYENYYTVPVSVEHMTMGVSKRIGEWPTLTGDPFVSSFENIKLK
ncbi:MAG: ABC transporter substrate-binding protein [Chloroflexi bacterium]|nr:ABC transporter substrate-binding protein [Chloroflexota bacterium]